MTGGATYSRLATAVAKLLPSDYGFAPFGTLQAQYVEIGHFRIGGIFTQADMRATVSSPLATPGICPDVPDGLYSVVDFRRPDHNGKAALLYGSTNAEGAVAYVISELLREG